MGKQTLLEALRSGTIPLSGPLTNETIKFYTICIQNLGDPTLKNSESFTAAYTVHVNNIRDLTKGHNEIKQHSVTIGINLAIRLVEMFVGMVRMRKHY